MSDLRQKPLPSGAPAGPGGLAWSGVVQPPPMWAYSGSGEDLAVLQGALLPMCCVKCGARERLVPRDHTFSWTPPWIWAFLPFGVLIPVILSAVLTKRARLRLPLCESCNRRWSAAILIAVFTVIGFLVGLVGGIALIANDLVVPGLLLLLGTVVAPFVIGPVVTRPRLLRARRIDNGWITIRGMHPEARQASLDHQPSQAARPLAPSLPAGSIQQPPPA